LSLGLSEKDKEDIKRKGMESKIILLDERMRNFIYKSPPLIDK
jgi:hypothetical protein